MPNIASVVLVGFLMAACSGAPPTVERIEIVNPTDYDVAVDVSGPDRQGWLPLSVAEHRSSVTVSEVIDQGERWSFRFRHFGEAVGEISLSRDQLEANEWLVEIPAEVGERLRDLGRQPLQ
jgi:hypothetical protein